MASGDRYSLGSNSDSGSDASTLNIDDIFPVDSVLVTHTNTNPSTVFTGTTWEALDTGRVLVGAGKGSDENGTTRTFSSGSTRGTVNHTLTAAQMRNHTHQLTTVVSYEGGDTDYGNAGDGDGGLINKTSSTGGSEAHNNIAPMYGAYAWRRTE